MVPLENRRWFLLLTFAVSALLVVFWFWLCGITLGLRTLPVFMLAIAGQAMGVNRLLALAFIKMRPTLGEV